MLASDLSPFAMTFLAVCGSSPSPYPDDPPTSTGFRCSDYQLMIDVEFNLGRACTLDDECDQVIPVSDSCTTEDVVLNINFNAVYVLDMIEEAEGVGCLLDYGSRGDCDPDAETYCSFGRCSWD